MSATDKELAAKKLQDPNITEAGKEAIRLVFWMDSLLTFF